MVYSKSDDEQMGHLKVVLHPLKEHQLFAKYSMCEFLLKSIAFVCYVVLSEGIQVDPKKIKAVRN